jgi:hypothetical protein
MEMERSAVRSAVSVSTSSIFRPVISSGENSREDCRIIHQRDCLSDARIARFIFEPNAESCRDK